MTLTRRALLTSLPLTALLAAATTDRASAESLTAGTTVRGAGAVRARWLSGVCDDAPATFGSWRGSPVGIVGMFGDGNVQAQLEQYQFTHSTFAGAVDLAVGGPIDRSWAQAAAGSEDERWTQIAGLLRSNWHYSTVYLRFAHEFNGTWMPWSVAPAEVAAFRTAFRRFAGVMRSQLRGHDVKIVFAPNFGTWRYTPDSAWPGTDVVDVVGVSTYEWTLYNSAARWNAFVKSSIGPNTWMAFAKRHGRPMAFSEWGGRSPYFISCMNTWMAAHAGNKPGQLLYDVYLNGRELLLTGATATQYRKLHWGN